KAQLSYDSVRLRNVGRASFSDDQSRKFKNSSVRGFTTATLSESAPFVKPVFCPIWDKRLALSAGPQVIPFELFLHGHHQVFHDVFLPFRRVFTDFKAEDVVHVTFRS